jgi:hypothetical protein
MPRCLAKAELSGIALENIGDVVMSQRAQRCDPADAGQDPA